MSLAYNLVNSLAETESNEDLMTLVIDHHTRTIQIPKGIVNLGVESDDEVLRLKFKMPRYLGTVDLYDFNIRINYINAHGEDDVYKVNDAAISGDNITFSWLVGPTATAYKGDTKFNVCMIVTDADSVIQKEYNTSVASLPVLEGLECDERVILEYSDILQQWENRLFGIGDTEEAKLLAVSDAQQANITGKGDEILENIVDKGIEVLGTIPQDYQTTYDMANNAYRTRANAIVCSAEGESIVLTDSSNDPLRGLRVFGTTMQYTSTGLNILDPNATATFLNNSGAEKTGIAIPIKTAGTYTYIVKDTVSVYIGYSDSLTTKATHFATANAGSGVKGTVVLTAGQYFMLWFDTGVTANNIDEYFLALGTDVEFEPFTNGHIAPSPEWPMNLTSIDGPGVSIRGKNLVDVTGEPVTWNGITFTPNQDGSVTVDGTATALTYMNTTVTLAPGDYILNGCPAGGDDSTYFIRVATSYDGLFDDRGNGVSFTLTKAQGVTVRIVIRPGVTTNNMIFKPMVRDASISDDTFEPFASRQILDTTHVLNGIQVSQNGNYTDTNGRQWICDEIDFERGVYIQRVFAKTLSGTEDTWKDGTISTTGQHYIYLADARVYVSNDTKCTHAVYSYDGTWDTGCYWRSGTNLFQIYTDMSITEWSTYLVEQTNAGTPVVLLCPLTTPIETPLTAEEIENFKMVSTNFPNTTILNDSGAWMEVKYNADTKTYLERLPKATDEQVHASISAWLDANADVTDEHINQLINTALGVIENGTY